MFVLIIHSLLLAYVLRFGEAEHASTKEEQRDLSYNSFMNYEPETDIIDKSRIDLDLKEMKSELAKETDLGFHNALETYMNGTYSNLYVELKLTEGVTVTFEKGTEVYGVSVTGKPQGGRLHENVPHGATTIKVEYHSSRICSIGVVSSTLFGCFAKSGNISVGYNPSNITVAYSYKMREDHKNGRSIRQYSTDLESDITSCDNCRYDDFNKFYDYYGQYDYADHMIISAFEAVGTDFPRGNADFKDMNKNSRSDVITIAASSMVVWMHIVVQMEIAIDKCSTFCVGDGCDTDAVDRWDDAAASYVGSEEDGRLGYMPYYNANMLCEKFNTCDISTANNKRQAKVNVEIMAEFFRGQQKLFEGRCENARKSKERIVQLMTVPLIQGTLRYTHLVVEEDTFRLQRRAEAAAYAAAVLPMVYACNKNDATTIYRNLKISNREQINIEGVKMAFESNYQCMGITCEDVGGLVSLFDDSLYQEGAQPCNYKDPNIEVANQEVQKKVEAGISGEQLWLVIGPSLTILVVFSIVLLRARRRRLYDNGKEADATLECRSNAPSIPQSIDCY